MNIIKSFKFKKGFLFSEKSVKCDELNSLLKISNKYFYYDNDLKVNWYEDDDCAVILAGLMFDIRSNDSDNDKCLLDIVNIIKSGNSILDYLEYTSGRYVIFYKKGDEDFRVISDATGLKSVFFAEKGGVCASHALLFANENEKSECAKYEQTLVKQGFSRFKYGYPGFSTPFNGVKILPPNNELYFSSGRIHRIFPRENINSDEFDRIEAVKFVHDCMGNQINSIRKLNKNIYCSLTAGIDSRFTLSAIEKNKDLKYFTYFYKGNNTHETDVFTSKLISRILGLSHKILEVNKNGDGTKDFEHFSRDLSVNNVFSAHAKSIAFSYLKNFGENNILIRSNLYEIGRAFWQSSGHNAMGFKDDPEKLAEYFAGIYNKNISRSSAAFVEFYNYLIESNFCKKCYDYDPLDLFYWEHRMGVWHSQVVVESDSAFETLILCNSRKILKIFLSFSLEDRKNGRFFEDFINFYLPELKSIPINSHKRDEYSNFVVNLSNFKNKLTAKITTMDECKEDKFAFYLYKDKHRVSVCKYSEKNVVDFEVNEPGDYYVRGFVKNSLGILAKNSNVVRYLGGVKNISIDDIDSEFEKSGVYSIRVDNWNFDVNLKKGNGGLIVFLNGAVGDRMKVKLPLFQRSSWASDFSDSVLNISDPTLNKMKNLRLGWYWGTQGSPLIDEISKLIVKIASSLGVKQKDIVIYGSSGGGYAAIRIGAYLNSGVCVVAINPQTNILNYAEMPVVDFLKSYFSSENIDLKDVERNNCDYFSVIPQCANNPNLRLVYYQNKKDLSHYKKHFIPFIEKVGLKEDAINLNKRMATITFEDSRGHVGEDRSMAVKLVNIVRAI